MTDYGCIRDLKENEIAVTCPNQGDFELRYFKTVGGKKIEMSFKYSNPERIIDMTRIYLSSDDAQGTTQNLRISQTAQLNLESRRKVLTEIVEAHNKNLVCPQSRDSGFSSENS